MAYKHVELDLRLKHHRTRKDYWRGVREGRIPWPKYKKPVLTAIELDPRQAVLKQCYVGTTGWMQGPKCRAYKQAGDTVACVTGVRGVQKNGVWEGFPDNTAEPPS